jgi:hypothetical protein
MLSGILTMAIGSDLRLGSTGAQISRKCRSKSPCQLCQLRLATLCFVGDKTGGGRCAAKHLRYVPTQPGEATTGKGRSPLGRPGKLSGIGVIKVLPPSSAPASRNSSVRD